MRQAYGLCCGQRKLNAEPAIRLPGRKDQHTKMDTRTLQDTRLSCGKRMVYTMVGEGLDAEPAIRLLSRKYQHTKSGTLILQDARLLCDKRMAYATV